MADTAVPPDAGLTHNLLPPVATLYDITTLTGGSNERSTGQCATLLAVEVLFAIPRRNVPGAAFVVLAKTLPRRSPESELPAKCAKKSGALLGNPVNVTL